MKHNLYNVDDRKYHYFYKITNNITGQYYYGIHSTNDLNDGYMGSGQALKRAMDEYSKHNFTKEIIKIFNNRDEASVYENKIVTQDIINDVNCYNLRTGGDYGACMGTILCFDTKTGEMLRCKLNDPEYLNGTCVPFMTGRVVVIDLDDNLRKVVSCEEYQNHKEKYITPTTGRIVVKDKNNNIYSVDKSDIRYKNGELVAIWKYKKHKEQTKQKISNSKKGTGIGKYNSQYGTCWVTKNKQNKKIKLDELESYICGGWRKGRYFINDLKTLIGVDPKIIYNDRLSGMTWKELSNKYHATRGVIVRYLKRNNMIN